MPSPEKRDMKWAKEILVSRGEMNPHKAGNAAGLKEWSSDLYRVSINIIQNCHRFPRAFSCLITHAKYLPYRISVFPHTYFLVWFPCKSIDKKFTAVELYLLMNLIQTFWVIRQ